MARKYQLKQRAETQEVTRGRIVEAAIALHESVGDAATTISAIAERAGVGRVTVYRHFPDERALLTACTGHYLALHPPPDPRPWRAIDDPGVRLQTGLGELYDYYQRTEAMMARADQDAPVNPVLAELLAPLAEYKAGLRAILASGWPTTESGQAMVSAAVGHALTFSTWRSLVREQGLNSEQAVALMCSFVQCAVPTAGEFAPTS